MPSAGLIGPAVETARPTIDDALSVTSLTKSPRSRRGIFDTSLGHCRPACFAEDLALSSDQRGANLSPADISRRGKIRLAVNLGHEGILTVGRQQNRKRGLLRETRLSLILSN